MLYNSFNMTLIPLALLNIFEPDLTQFQPGSQNLTCCRQESDQMFEDPCCRFISWSQLYSNTNLHDSRGHRLLFFCCCARYDSEGRLTNVTYPTGMVTSLHREIERSINIDIESSNRDDDVTVITNLSSVEASYTVVQGEAMAYVVGSGVGGIDKIWSISMHYRFCLTVQFFINSLTNSLLFRRYSPHIFSISTYAFNAVQKGGHNITVFGSTWFPVVDAQL